MSLLLVVCSLLAMIGMGSTQSSDGSLTLGSSFNILGDNSDTLLTSSFLFGKQFNITDNSTTIYFFSRTSENTVWWVNIDKALDSISTEFPNGDISLVNSVQIEDPNGNPILSAGAIDPRVNGSMYIASINNIYRIYPNRTTEILKIPADPSGSTSFLPPGAATDTKRYRAFYPSTIGPYLYSVDFTTAAITYTTFNTSSSVSAISINSFGTNIFLGGYTGDVEVISLDSLSTVAFSPGTDAQARYGTNQVSRKNFVDSAAYGRLYVCTEVVVDSFTQIWVDVLNSTTLAFIRSYELLPTSGTAECGAITIDDDEGQVFVGVSDDNGGTLFAINIVNKTIRDFTPILESNFVAAYKIGPAGVTEGQVVYLATSTQLTRLTYLSTCPNDCSSNGICSLGNCTCIDGYYTEDCSQIRCPGDCSGHGTCADGACVCDSIWDGPNCTDRICANSCSGHGTCSGGPSYICTCTDNWSGSDCSTPPPPPPPPTCASITAIDTCIGYVGCGWCITTKTCHDGSIRGPYVGSCYTWIWGLGFEAGVIILAAIFLGILFLMFVINAISAIRVDFDRADDFRELYASGVRRKADHQETSALWWRDVRSAKTWLLVEQFQFLVLVSHIAVDFPTNYINFTKFFDWTNLGLPLPFKEDKTTVHTPRYIYNQSDAATNQQSSKYLSSAVIPDVTSGRSLLGFEAYSNSLGITANTLFGANMFWLAISIASVCFVYGWACLITIKKAHWKSVFVSRLIYLLVRLGNLAYVGVVMTSSYSLVSYTHGADLIVPAVFAFVIMGFGYPIGIYFLLRGDGKKLLDEEFKYRFGALYINYQPGNRLFVLMVFARKFITAAMVGFLNYSLYENPRYISIVQVIIMGLAQIIYALVVFFRKPYYDYYHEYLEYFLTVINLVTLGLSMLHYRNPSTPGMLITGLVQAIALVACTAVYIVSWVHMGLNLSCCGGKSKKEKQAEVKQSVPLNDSGDADAGIEAGDD